MAATPSDSGSGSEETTENSNQNDPGPVDTSSITPAQMASWGLQVAPAVEVPASGNSESAKEAALQTASTEAAPTALGAPSGPNIESVTAMTKLIQAFSTETDDVNKQDLLAVAGTLATNSGADLRPLLKAALSPGQPLDVQRQALYLASSVDRSLVTGIAASATHPLKEDAQAFLMEPQSPAATASPTPTAPQGK